MIPSVLSRQIQQGIKDFLHTSFPISNRFFSGILDGLLEGEGIFRGPYLSLQLPFLQGQDRNEFFPDIPLDFTPYQHQEEAFQRLSGAQPLSTIIATGTGSGKTECFLYPVLDYCYRNRGQSGMKAILIYPMNALASDQASRIARIIWHNPRLRGRVTAGLFIGQSERDPRMVMGADGIITNKETLRLAPPDILLTNYKMLDYLLVRPRDFPLWAQNQPETLRYLVVDELHTFNGAQGTDLACLIRRLKARLKTPTDSLCAVGTSATLGEAHGAAELIGYASQIFGEPFEPSSLIGESRQSAAEFLADALVSSARIIPPEEAADLEPSRYATRPDYIRALHELWFDEPLSSEAYAGTEWRLDLAVRLKEHPFFQNLLKVMRGRVRSLQEILADLERASPELRDADTKYQVDLLNSLIALISEARVPAETDQNRKSGRLIPFLDVRFHLWLRELRRMVGQVALAPQMRFADDLTEEQLQRHMSLIHCRDCGALGWGGTQPPYEDRVNPDLQTFYQAYFRHHRRVVQLFPEEGDPKELGLEGQTWKFCTGCLHLHQRLDDGVCTNCRRQEVVQVFIPNVRTNKDGRAIGLDTCPYCRASQGLTILGFRAASLTSVLVNQLFSSTFNDDKKLLTFSDSVQDAAHRAGFFASRTYRFNFRSALQQFVLHGGEGVKLSELFDAFSRYWAQRMSPPEFIATFLAPNMHWFADWEELRKTDQVAPRLRNDVERRLHWEILAEYGFRARIGRSLERTASSMVEPDPETLERIVETLLPKLQNEIGPLRALEPDSLRLFLSGLMAHLKNRGAVEFHGLDDYVESFGNTYTIKLKRWMPGFGTRTRNPSFLSTRRKGGFDLVATSGKRAATWYEIWIQKCFAQHALVASVTPAVYDLTLTELAKAGFLRQWELQGHRIWGLRPEQFRVTTKVDRSRCDRCSHITSVPNSQKSLWEAAPCTRLYCGGHYQPEPPSIDYYAGLYADGDIRRIFSEEHTGLLDRDSRDELERRFKAEGENRRPWFPNLLSCTPTLEMGIDIGDLSSVILCSVPPAQSNYLQRIGRAGRRDGNSLAVSVANARPHDLYFYFEPFEMIAGKIEPPGVFLNASAVLERQLTAFCLDRWVETGIKESEFPRILGSILGKLEPQDFRRFPHNFLRFVENHRTQLFDDFVEIFQGHLTDSTIEHLKEFLDGEKGDEGSLVYKIIHGLFAQHSQREDLRRKIRLLRNRIRRMEQSPAKDKNYQDELRDLQQEREALQSLVSTISDKDIFNFFTDEGLLPNYAFPEAGVLLRSVIYRKKEKVQEGEAKYDTWSYEFQRPAMAAIAELAPENEFFAGGRKVEIDQIDMAVSKVEEWRFCRNCAYSERIGLGTDSKACPQCGDVMWSDSGQRRSMVRMRQVVATSDDRSSRIADDNDDREPNFYQRQTLVQYKQKDVQSAYQIQRSELPFGFEFLSRANFKEINFGETTLDAEKVRIAGIEIPRRGFRFCRVCGKIEKRNGDLKHALSCTARDQESDKNFVDCAFLYREFSSEAIRILLPVTNLAGSEKILHSFVAALHLGLKRKFGGSIEHLQTALHEEPIPDSSYRKKFLVLYDTVPGGTGYLKQLTHSGQEFLEILELALEAIRACPCVQEEDKDGCYRCLFAYRRSRTMPETSRDTAVELLSRILEQRDTLESIESVSQISVNVLFDSELEKRFIEALRRSSTKERPVMISRQVVNGKPGHFLRVGETRFLIEPQADLGPSAGVKIPSRADFMFWPARESADQLPIAVFADGFQYHRERIGEDLAQRMALLKSGRYLTWSLTWNDVDSQFKIKHDYFRNFTISTEATSGKNYHELCRGYGLDGFISSSRKGSFEWLLDFLAKPKLADWRKYAFVHGLLHVDPRQYTTDPTYGIWQEDIRAEVPDEAWPVVAEATDSLHGRFAPKALGEEGVRLSIQVPKDALQPPRPESMLVFGYLDDGADRRTREGFERIWNGYLRLFNLFQFLPSSVFVSREGLDKNAYAKVSWAEAEVTTSLEVDAAWAEVQDLVEESLFPLLARLSEARVPVPEVGYELQGSSGAILGEAELTWEEAKIAVLANDRLEGSSAFTKTGWQVFELDQVIAKPEVLLEALR